MDEPELRKELCCTWGEEGAAEKYPLEYKCTTVAARR